MPKKAYRFLAYSAISATEMLLLNLQNLLLRAKHAVGASPGCNVTPAIFKFSQYSGGMFGITS